MRTIEGHFFDGIQPVPVPARLDFEGENAVLTADELAVRYNRADLVVSPRIDLADRFIALPDGMQFVCADQDFLDTLPQESSSEGIVAWLEHRWQMAIAGVAIVIVSLLAGYFYGLPVLARHLANRIPMEAELAIGSQALGWFEEQNWIAPTTLEADQKEDLLEGFNHLTSDLPYPDFYRLEFRSSKVFGPNAFALPGGIIILTDELVALSETNEEVLAVLAHEIGHVDLRHAMRSVLQNSIVAATVATITADAATLSVAVAGLPMVLAQTQYSRQFETASDDYAFRLLKRKGYSPAAFATIMEKMDKKREGRSSGFSYFSTHPLTDERVQAARRAAEP